MAAASNGHLEAATSLVKAGAALDKQNGDGHSSLMFAYNGRAQVCCCAMPLDRSTTHCMDIHVLVLYIMEVHNYHHTVRARTFFIFILFYFKSANISLRPTLVRQVLRVSWGPVFVSTREFIARVVCMYWSRFSLDWHARALQYVL